MNLSVAMPMMLLLGCLDDTTHPVVTLFIYLDAMNLTFESGKAFAEFFSCKNEANNWALRAAEPLARHTHRNPGRIWNQHHRTYTAMHLCKANLLCLVPQKFLVGLGGSKNRVKVLIAGIPHQGRQIELNHGSVHLVGEFFERYVAITIWIL